MKILHYINNLGSGGAEKLLSDVLPLMHKEGHAVHLVITNNSNNVKSFEEIIINSGIKLINLKKSFYNPFQVFQLIYLLRKEKYDIIHSHLFPSQYWLSFASLFIGKKSILIKTEHSVFNERKNYKFLRRLEIFVYNRYRAIICITEDVKDNLSAWIGERQKLIVIKNGVNLKQFKFSKDKLLLVQDVYDENDINILMVGRFDGIAKDQKTVVNALKTLPSNYKLFFAGEGPALQSIKNYVEKLDLTSRVNFLGVRNDVNNLMTGANINVLSTNFEGLSGVTLESLASGQPFLGSDVVGVNSIVPNDKFLFEKGNVAELAAKIKLIINDDMLRGNMIIEASMFIENFDVKIMVNKYLSLYKSQLSDF